MDGERSSKTPMRLAGKICCFCGRYFDAMLWQPLPSEPAIRAQPNAHRLRNSAGSIFPSFFESDGIALSWKRTSALMPLPPRTFTNPDNMIEMIRRGNGFRDLASKQAAEHAIMAGRGNVDLLLTPEQYARLVG
jgi:hypothetical protein